MQCGRCGAGLAAGASRRHDGQERCEDCYISAATRRHLDILRAQKQHEQVLIALF